MLWLHTPKEITLSKEDSIKRYKHTRYQDLVVSLDDGSHVANQEMTIIRGCKEYIMRHYRWNDSNTNGGYIEAVTYRYLRRKFKNHAGIYNNNRDNHQMIIRDVVYKLAEKYYMHGTTSEAVIKHLNHGRFRP